MDHDKEVNKLIIPNKNLKNDAKYLVFVDFDGVLTSNRVHFSLENDDAYMMWAQFDPIAIQFFNKIHYTYKDVRFVWTTTWRNHIQKGRNIEHIAYSQWYNAGFRGLFGVPWTVNPTDRMDGEINHASRAEEIKDYLENWSNAEDYIIFDDMDYGFNRVLGKKRFIRTDADNGMLFSHMRRAWELIGHWEKR